MLYIARAAGADNSHNRKRQFPFHPSSQTVKQHVKEALEGSALLVMIDKITQPGCLQVYHADLRSSTECCVLVCVSLLRGNSRRRRTLVKLFCSSAMSMSPQRSADESLWQAINADIGALQQIVSSHFRTDCQRYTRMNDGAYARAFLFSLVTGTQVIGRVILPVRESIKTEAEVTIMELVRGNQIVHGDPLVISLRFNKCPMYIARGGVPVPLVYLYCSTPNNPVGAEWIIMEYMPGKLFGDCIESLTDQQKRRTGTDLAGIMFALFQITAPQCGSLIRLPRSGLHDYQDDQSLRHRALRYPTHSRGITLGSNLHCVPATLEPLSIGPVNDIAFLDYPRQLPPHVCGPFNTEREWMDAFAFLGKPPTRQVGKLEYWAFEKTLEVYDVITRFCRPTTHSTPHEQETFHLAHGDFSSYNILIDPATGAITGIIDWEMAGFRPAWLASVGGGWFNDDSERFLMTDDQSGRGNHADESPADAITRSQFRLRLAELDEDLFRHHLQGIELRALFYACCNEYPMNTEVWLKKYIELEWSVRRRGPFPFDYWGWVNQRIDLWKKYVVSDSTRWGNNKY